MPRKSLVHPPGSSDQSSRSHLTRDIELGDSLGEVMALYAHTMTIQDDRTRNARLEVLVRTMSGISGTVGGFGVKPEWAESVFDQARMVDGPYVRCQWRTCQAREFQWPIFGGSSRSNGGRWGGMTASWGLTETADQSVLAASAPLLGNVVFSCQPCAIYSGPISRDLLADTMLIAPALDYAARAEIRYAIEYSLINGRSGGGSTRGPGNLAGPQGVIGAASTVTVAKESGQSNGTIVSANVDKLWAAIASGNKRGCVWHCSDDTLTAIDQIAVSGQWSESSYMPQGKYGNEFALIKGRPVLVSEACPVIGQVGDLCAVDWTDYWLVHHKVKPSDSGLAFNLTQPRDSGHLGVVGIPADAIEARVSDQFLWSTDQAVFMWRFRADGNFLWPGPMTNPNGKPVGPAAVLAAR